MKSKIIIAILAFFLINTIQPKFSLNIQPPIKKTAYLSIGSLFIINGIFSYKKYGFNGFYPKPFFTNFISIFQHNEMILVTADQEELAYNTNKIISQYNGFLKQSNEMQHKLEFINSHFDLNKFSIPQPVLKYDPYAEEKSQYLFYWKNRKDHDDFITLIQELRIYQYAKQTKDHANLLDASDEGIICTKIIKQPLATLINKLTNEGIINNFILLEKKKEIIKKHFQLSGLAMLLEHMLKSPSQNKTSNFLSFANNNQDRIIDLLHF